MKEVSRTEAPVAIRTRTKATIVEVFPAPVKRREHEKIGNSLMKLTIDSAKTYRGMAEKRRETKIAR